MVYKSPGVYVEEIALFPPSVAEVATAVPAFIGYTEKAVKNGGDLTNKPTRITSLLEYRDYFGGDSELTSSAIDVKVDTTKNNAVSITKLTRWYLFEGVRLYFDNGGGACYIVSVGDYSATPTRSTLKGGLDAIAKYDEPTILLIPDAFAAGLTRTDLYSLHVDMLLQAATLQDRVAVLDLPNTSIVDAAAEFRDRIGINNMKYGAAYAPWIITSYPKTVPFKVLAASTKDESNAALKLETLSTNAELNNLVINVQTANADEKAVGDKVKTLRGSSVTLTDHFNKLRRDVKTAADAAAAKAALIKVIEFLRDIALGALSWRTDVKGDSLKKTLDAEAANKIKASMDAFAGIDRNLKVQALTSRTDAIIDTQYGAGKYDAVVGTWITAKPKETTVNPTDYTKAPDNSTRTEPQQAVAVAADLVPVFDGFLGFIAAIETAAKAEVGRLETVLYATHPTIANIVGQIVRRMSEMPPSGAVAGVYAMVDSTRGVWKAPANVSLNQVIAPVEAVDNSKQDDLNVDVTGGKSINVIRAFTGRGTLVWGARTLAGNDNEWRYIPVRRFYNMVEESVKKSTAWAVFEPNAAPLWTKVKSMIDNYLVQKWRDGALAGATPDDAFFVNVGLGTTMTAIDILEGRLIVEIGMAVVRPAEFIILKFSHKMQKS